MIALLALAASMPALDSSQYCQSISTLAAGHSYSLELTCDRMEAEARARLELQDVPPDVARWCGSLATTSGAGSYRLYEACVARELDAARQLGRVR